MKVMRRMTRGCWIGALGALAAAAVFAGNNAHYTPPGGFNGLAWGAPLSALGKVKLARANTATDSRGKVTQLRCAERPEGCASAGISDQDVEGAGSFSVAEYYREPDSNPWAQSLVALQAATYLFCDEWLGPGVRKDVKQRMRLCGARIFYRSESAAQLAGKSAKFESNHARVLRHLIAEFGPYDGQRVKKGEVVLGPVIEAGATEPEPTEMPADAADDSGQGVARYRWCGLPANSGQLVPDCPATITLLFNHQTGWGMVLFATESMYKFAYARHVTQDENNELYMALVSRDPGKPTRRNANDCQRTTGSLVCGGKLLSMPDSERRRFEP